MRTGEGLLGRLAEGGRRPLVVDSSLAALYAAGSLVLGQETPAAPWQPMDALGRVLILLVSAALTVRRVAPVPVLAAVIALWLGYIGCGYWPVVNSPAVLLALYTVAAAHRTRTAAVCAAAVGVTWVVAGLLGGRYTPLPAVAVQAVAFPGVVAFLGRGAGVSAERSRRLAVLTDRLRAEQELRAERAVTEERVRIARELHDVVAHHMSVVSLQAGMASYVVEVDPVTAKGALEAIATTSREALEELRRLLALLRVGPEGEPEGAGEAAPYAPAPGLDRLEELVRRVRAAGVPTELRREGTPFRLPPGMDLCAYRVVQEALTNVLRHAGPAAAVVLVRYAARTLTVRITDDGNRSAPADSPSTGGHGLIGMHERAKIYRGTVSAGPRAGGGFEVELRLPAPHAAGGEPVGRPHP
ncbi:sensor histidine kinase [Kitasatospora sp. NA04385]|uniref:sensor histidine kinase n=1 Tax=Kitasatospora sp. NA04385 TaxID=2742135 RepID=UPI001591CB36|nr:histidine kinase [Kitasatospora sp. NA04385]QKW19293.1 sensor histidine kinase [Kitasatospora sp. NA04385]